MMITKRFVAAAVAVGVVLVGASCGEDTDTAAAVEAQGAWARTSPGSAENGAAYMVLTSDDDDALIGASVSTDVAGTTEIHETVMADGAEGSDMGETDGDAAEMPDDMDRSEGMGGTMSMQEVSSISLPAGEPVSLEPGGFHVMMLDLVDPLEPGETFELTLDFESGTSETVEVEVRDEAP